jgi:DNA polymerase-3 subunit epsilon
MELNLERPLVFFDIESTGLNIATDSIVELSFVKALPGVSEPLIKTWRVRPWDYENNCQRPINPSAMEVTGITNEELINEKCFWEIAHEVAQEMKDCDLAGFNSAKFDLPLLAEEFERARKFKNIAFDINLHEVKMIDVQAIFHKLEPRNLKAAYRFYCNQELENAHAAEADTLATYEVLKGQLDRYTPNNEIKNDVEWLSNFSTFQRTVDYAGRLVYNENKEAVISFGKHRGRTAREVYATEPSYFAWIESGDFTLDTKRQFALLKEQFDKEKREAKAAFTKEKSRPLSSEELMNAFGNSKYGQGKLF